MPRDNNQKQNDRGSVDDILRRYSTCEREASQKINELEAESNQKDRTIQELQDELRTRDAQIRARDAQIQQLIEAGREKDKKILELSAAFHMIAEIVNPRVLPVLANPPQPKGTDAGGSVERPQLNADPQPQCNAGQNSVVKREATD